MKKRKLTGFELVWYLGVFGFLLVWFTQIHPLVVYDADDWTYLAYVRSATPIWGDWNPAKVFPETVMPFFSTVAVYTLMPLQVYFKGSLVKVQVGLARGKKLYDKRADIAKKDQRRELEKDFKVKNLY